MSKYTLDTDFEALKPTQAVKWLSEFPKIVEEEFADKNNQTRLLGHLLLLEAYTNTIRHGLELHQRQIFPLIQQGLDFLSGYMEGTIEASEFQEFAGNLYACVLEYNTGEELLDSQQKFYQQYFHHTELCADEWAILE